MFSQGFDVERQHDYPRMRRCHCGCYSRVFCDSRFWQRALEGFATSATATQRRGTRYCLSSAGWTEDLANCDISFTTRMTKIPTISSRPTLNLTLIER